MTVYFDSSVILRVVLREPRGLKDRIFSERAISSAILRVECLRALDRLRLEGRYADEALAKTYRALMELVAPIDLLDVTPAILERASQPLRLPLRTLDAIHLSTAAQWREHEDDELLFATHDRTLGSAAESYGFDVVGL